jgi:hypothetical protein
VPAAAQPAGIPALAVAPIKVDVVVTHVVFDVNVIAPAQSSLTNVFTTQILKAPFDETKDPTLETLI